MVKKTQILLTDDIDGTEAIETIQFAMDGIHYEIDLNGKNATAFREAVARYVGAARKSGRSRADRRGSRDGGATDYDPKAVRAWAASNKIQVPARGRIPATVIEQFRSAGN
jgi:hypothetical protein